jgi:hypothetical protein
LRWRSGRHGASFIDNIDRRAADVANVTRLFFVLAWSGCIRATWMFSAGRRGPAAEALAAAFRFLDESGRTRDSGFRWRPILAPHHGLTVARRP